MWCYTEWLVGEDLRHFSQIEITAARLWLGFWRDLPGAGKFVIFETADGRDTAWAYSDGRPAVIAGTAGEGRVVYSGPELGAAYYRNGYPYLRHLMEATVRWAAPEPPQTEVRAPLTVQATFFEQPTEAGETRQVIHLLNECWVIPA